MIPALTAGHSPINGFSPLIGVGIALNVSGTIVFVFGVLIVQFRRVARMREVIAEESMKYSSRSLTPCSWRLENMGNLAGAYGNQYNRRALYCVSVIILLKSSFFFSP
jgi:hypothetical protein